MIIRNLLLVTEQEATTSKVPFPLPVTNLLKDVVLREYNCNSSLKLPLSEVCGQMMKGFPS